MVSLRPYQQQALDAILAAYRRGVRKQLVVMPTGTGKTVLFSALPKALFDRGPYKTLILAHRDELVTQAREKFLLSNPTLRVGIEKGDAQAHPCDDVVCASVQTLSGDRLKRFKARWQMPNLIITDEAHHAIAPGYGEIYEAYRPSPLLHIGLTATPARGDKVGLDTVFDELVFSISIEDAIANGSLTPLEGYKCVTTTQLTGIARSASGDFSQRQLAHAINTDERNAEVVRAYLDLAPGKKAIVFGVDIAHSKALAMAFAASGARSAHLDGSLPMDKRRRVLAAFSRGEIDILCNCATLTEGYDEPSIACVILARPTLSAALYTQMVGRGTRLAPGKTTCVVIDMHDVSKSRSCFSLPALFGAPPDFDLAGRDALETAKRVKRLIAEVPFADEVIESAHDLDLLERLPTSKRLQLLIDALRRVKNQRYLSVDLLRPRPVPQEVADAAAYTWHAIEKARFMLQLDDERLSISDNLLGQWDVYLEPQGMRPMRLGTFVKLGDAIARAERYARFMHERLLALVEKGAQWRDRPSTGLQRWVLRKHGIKVGKTENFARGEAQMLISLLNGMQSRV